MFYLLERRRNPNRSVEKKKTEYKPGRLFWNYLEPQRNLNRIPASLAGWLAACPCELRRTRHCRIISTRHLQFISCFTRSQTCHRSFTLPRSRLIACLNAASSVEKERGKSTRSKACQRVETKGTVLYLTYRTTLFLSPSTRAHVHASARMHTCTYMLCIKLDRCSY